MIQDMRTLHKVVSAVNPLWFNCFEKFQMIQWEYLVTHQLDLKNYAKFLCCLFSSSPKYWACMCWLVTQGHDEAASADMPVLWWAGLQIHVWYLTCFAQLNSCSHALPLLALARYAQPATGKAICQRGGRCCTCPWGRCCPGGYLDLQPSTAQQPCPASDLSCYSSLI